MKIKKFRIRPRLPTVGKLIKAALSVRQLPPEIEETLSLESENFLKHAVPTALSQTWSIEELDGSLKGLLHSPGHKDAVALSAVVATIGQEPEEILSAALMGGESTRAHVITALANESADLSMAFITRLLSEDAQQDGCILSDPIVVSESLLVETVLRCVDGSQEGLTVDTAGHVSPRFTRIALFVWSPLKKKKRQAALPNKKTP